MTKQLTNPILKDDFSAGVIRKVSIDKMPQNATPYAVNFIFDEIIGSAILRKGTSMIGNQIVDNKNVLGLTNFRRRADSNHALLAVVSDGSNNDIYKATAWAKSLEDDTKDLKTRFAQFLDSVVRVNGTDGAKSFDGTSWITTGGVFDLGNMPQGKFVVNYKDRVHVMDEDGVLYSSSIPRFYLDYDGQTVDFNVGAILTGAGGAIGDIFKDTDNGSDGILQLTAKIGEFVNDEAITDNIGGAAVADGTGGYRVSWTDGYITTPIDPDNGAKGKGTGFGVIGGLLFIFFERAFYTWNGKSTEADEITDIGCSSQESVAKCKGRMFFANKDGIYMTQGGFPQLISRYVQDIFDNMSSSNYADIAGGCDGQHYYCSLGDVTIDGITISNLVLRYTILSQEWAIFSMPTKPMVFSQYIDGTDVKLVYGDDDGNVIQIDSTATADTYAATTVNIDFELHTHDIIGATESKEKSLENEVNTVTEASSGAKFYYRADKDDTRHEDWKLGTEIKKNNQEIKIPKIRFKKLRFKIAGTSNVGRLVIKKVEALKNNIHF